MFGIELQPRPHEWVTRLWMAQASNKSACYLLVEGPDDVAALQKFVHQSCRVAAAGGKSNVEEALSNATRAAVAANRPLEGLLGAVDRDFDHVAGVPAHKHPRLARIEHPNDLESSVAHYRGHDLYDSVFQRDLVKSSKWLGYSDSKLDQPFDRLVRSFAGPLGALRAAWRASGFAHQSLDPDSALARTLFASVYSSHSLQQVNLQTVLPSQLSTPQREELLKRARGLQDTAEAEGDLWRFVRGKDLLDACAHAASKERCAIRSDLKASELRFELGRMVVALFDHELLTECGLKESLVRASTLDAGKHQYLHSA